MKKWNGEVFGNVEKQKRVLLEELRVLDDTAEGRFLSHDEKLRKTAITRGLERTFLSKN